MIQLKLDKDEAIVLTNMLEECIIKVHQEIAATERTDYRQMLKHRKTLLMKILKEISVSDHTPVAV
jgi:hypothetical protein